MHSKPILSTLMLAVSAACLAVPSLYAQPGAFSKEDLLKYTPEWKGERFPDGRPKVPDGILKRMRAVTLEEAWAVLRNEGYNYQYEDGWMTIHPDKVLVGRALTAVWMPGRPDVQRVIEAVGKQEHRIGATNAWAVDMLQPGDVYVVDHYGNKLDGPSIGDNVGSSIYAKSGNGIVYDGAVRDIQGLKELENFTSFIRSYHPSHHFGMLGSPKFNTTLMGINCPVRIGQATVMPGDVVLGREGSVIFIPPQFAEKVVKSSEFIRLQDLFGHQRLREGKYTAGQIDAKWSDAIEKDFSDWLRQNIATLPVANEQIQEILKERKW